MASSLILGAGKFGRLALRRLRGQDSHARFLVIDRQAKALAAARISGGEAAELLEGEAIPFLSAHLGPASPWDWLIPMVPVHVAYSWLMNGPLARENWEPAGVPESLKNLAALSIPGPRGELYLSQARHLCPDDCAEPDTCPVTGEARREPLCGKLAEASCKDLPILVMASTQLAPGVGGYPPQELVKLAEMAAAAKGPVLVATACRCHGVMHGLKRKGERAA